MERDVKLFGDKKEFQKFLRNSVIQYIKLKFGNKKRLILFIRNKLNIKIPKTASYRDIIEILQRNSIDFYHDILNVQSPLEIAHLYSFYRMLTNIFWETSWVKAFSPFYEFVFDKKQKLKIKNKSEQRKYAAEIITKFGQQELQRKWVEYSLKPFPILYGKKASPVIHYEHLTIGPVGFLFSLYYRGREIFENHIPILSILVNTTPSGEDIFDWERTDIYKVFSTILDELNRKIDEIILRYPAYAYYLKLIRFEFPYSDWKNQLHHIVKLFRKYAKEGGVPLPFYQMVQLTAMFFTDEEIIDLLNRLLAEGKLIVKSETEIEDLKIAKEGIIKRPKSWLARPAVELARDIASIKSKEFEDVLTNILKEGAIKYFEEVYDYDFETFKRICIKKRLYKFGVLEKSIIPKKKAIQLVLESYGLRTPSMSPIEGRKYILRHIQEIKRFRKEYKDMEESVLVKNLINLLRDARTCFERILKEWFFIITSFVFHYEDFRERGLSTDIFVFDTPIFHIWYDREQKLNEIRSRYRDFFNKLTQVFKISNDLKNKINSYVKEGKIKFSLGDWLTLLRLLLKYIDSNLSKEFWDTLPQHFYKSIKEAIAEIEIFLTYKKTLWLLNLASHEQATTQFKMSTEVRRNALHILFKLEEEFISQLCKLPEIAIITKKVSDSQTGLEYYEAKLINNGTKNIRIYGVRFIEPCFLYYLIPRFDREREENVMICPVIINNLVDYVL